MTKANEDGGGAEGANITSPPAPAPAPAVSGSWTAEEMEAARPLPIPETLAEPRVATALASGVPHIGTGRVKPGGRPELE